MELWQPEIDIFHMPFGEMSITLEDVSILLKISETDKVVAADNFSSYTDDFCKESIEIDSKLCSVTIDEMKDNVNITKGSLCKRLG
ncbi:hypothetical protein Syun_027732 [Stephania yunnanensis]|uniref:Aminotransferase-like plant mobile domain-containing protein n=1 Tax=Stephania yunnanensis TaxID=152371 RepID=A0AAP0HQH4_9MAGN